METRPGTILRISRPKATDRPSMNSSAWALGVAPVLGGVLQRLLDQVGVLGLLGGLEEQRRVGRGVLRLVAGRWPRCRPVSATTVVYFFRESSSDMDSVFRKRRRVGEGQRHASGLASATRPASFPATHRPFGGLRPRESARRLSRSTINCNPRVGE